MTAMMHQPLRHDVSTQGAPGTSYATTARSSIVSAPHLASVRTCLRIVGILAFLAMGVAGLADGASYKITDLGLNLEPFDVNDSGQVVGRSLTSGGNWQAFLWQNGQVTNLSTLGGLSSKAAAINNQGQIVGAAETLSGDQHAILWQNGRVTDLGTLGGSWSVAAGLNDWGQIVGWSATDPLNSATHHAFLWQYGGMHDLGAGDWTNSWAYGINNSGQVAISVGQGTQDVWGHSIACLWQSGRWTLIGPSDGRYSEATGINNLGQMSGHAYRPEQGHSLTVKSFLWNNAQTTELGTLGGERTVVRMADDAGRMTGYSWTQSDEMHAVLWENGTLHDLNDMIGANSGWTLGFARGVNASGQISGVGTLNGERHGFLLTPQPGQVLSDVPEYRWNYGCSPTAAGMVVGYWDAHGYGGLIPGNVTPMSSGESTPGADHPRDTAADGYEPNYGNTLVNQMIASEGHHRDYWAPGFPANEGKYIDSPLPHHPDDSLADFMQTSRGVMANGWTKYGLIGQAMVDWAREERGYQSLKNWEIAGGYDWTFDFIKRRIDEGKPLVLDWPGHSVMCYGYIDGPGREDWLAVMDTWVDADSKDRTIKDEDGKEYGIQTRMEGDVEYWRFRVKDNSGYAYVTDALAWYPRNGNPTAAGSGLLQGDSFTRNSTMFAPGDIGYIVEAGTSGGSAQIVESPLDGTDEVLRLSTPDQNSYVSVETDCPAVPFTAIGFDYLFATDGKLSVFLNDTLMAEITSPVSGPGSAGADQYASFYRVFPLANMGFDTTDMVRLKIQLSHSDDPTVYLDDLSVWGIAAVPEPPFFTLIASGLLGLLAAATARKNAMTRRRSTY